MCIAFLCIWGVYTQETKQSRVVRAGELIDKTEKEKLFANKDLALRRAGSCIGETGGSCNFRKRHKQAVNTDYLSGLSFCSELCFSVLIPDSPFYFSGQM